VRRPCRQAFRGSRCERQIRRACSGRSERTPPRNRLVQWVLAARRALPAAHFGAGTFDIPAAYKQLIPYVVLKWRDELFHYTRGKRTTEARLQTLRSIGVGGHIEARDSNLYENAYREAMFREVNEEVDLQSSYTERCIGLINDDSTPVGQVHLGIVHVFELDQPSVRRREQALVRSGFAPLRQLRTERNEFERWSQFVLDVLET
jgi:predicted NUDIX family phosphoesterase